MEEFENVVYAYRYLPVRTALIHHMTTLGEHHQDIARLVLCQEWIVFIRQASPQHLGADKLAPFQTLEERYAVKQFAVKVPVGHHQLGFVFVSQKEQSNYYLAKKYLESLLDSLNVSHILIEFEKNETNSYYEPKRSATIKAGDAVLGYIGEIQHKVLRGFKLPKGTAQVAAADTSGFPQR